MLELNHLSVRYGAIQAVDGLSLTVRTGEIACLVGSNGAGKSSTLNAVCGVVRGVAGSIRVDGEPLNGLRASQIVRRGIVQVPEGRQVFPDLTVQENLEMGAYTQPVAVIPERLSMVFGFFPRLAERRTQLAGLMSGGEQQMLAIGRALMAGPRMLLLDEPSMGLAPLIVAEIFHFLRRLRDQTGLTILLVEQNVAAALALADRAYVLANGRLVASGTPDELGQSRATRDAFLGKARTPLEPAR